VGGRRLQDVTSQGSEQEWGLQQVLERLRQLGTRIRMTSKPGLYTKLRARLPALSIEPSADAASA
jgi:signal transduction histidine kinase